MSDQLLFSSFARRTIGLLMFFGLFACKGPAEKKGASITANDGIFNKSQVEKGAGLYTNICASCHGRDLHGSEGGIALIGDRFITKWKDQSLDSLFKLTKNTMPKTNPKSLDDESNASLIAFLLNANGFTPGQATLSSNPSILVDMVM